MRFWSRSPRLGRFRAGCGRCSVELAHFQLNPHHVCSCISLSQRSSVSHSRKNKKSGPDMVELGRNCSDPDPEFSPDPSNLGKSSTESGLRSLRVIREFRSSECPEFTAILNGRKRQKPETTAGSSPRPDFWRPHLRYPAGGVERGEFTGSAQENPNGSRDGC